MTKKAEMGISTLVLVLAMVLVAAVVMYTLTTSVGQVTQEANSVGKVAQANVGSAMTVLKLYAEDGTAGNSVDYFYEEIKPPYASDEIELDKTLLVMALSNTSNEYTYNSSINCTVDNTSNPVSVYNDTNTNFYGVQYVTGSATHADIIMPGELVRLCWKSPLSVVKDDKIATTFYSTVGYAAKLEVSYAGLIRDSKTVYFFP